MVSCEVPFKLTVIDFRANFFGTLIGLLLPVILDGGDDLYKEIKGALHSFLVIFDLLSDFVEEKFEVVFIVEVLDGQTDHVVKQFELALLRKCLLPDFPEKPDEEAAEECIWVVRVLVQYFPGNAKIALLSLIQW